jgi:hypothetical protein
VERAVEHRQIFSQLLLTRSAQPRRRFLLVGELPDDVDYRGATGCHGRRLRLSFSPNLLRPPPQSPRAPLYGADRRHHEHVRRRVDGLCTGGTQQVPPVGGTERPRELDLTEAKERRYRREVRDQAGRPGR